MRGADNIDMNEIAITNRWNAGQSTASAPTGAITITHDAKSSSTCDYCVEILHMHNDVSAMMTNTPISKHSQNAQKSHRYIMYIYLYLYMYIYILPKYISEYFLYGS